MHIGEVIRHYRKKQGLSQEQLSNGIVSISYLSKIENNKISADDLVVDLLLQRLNLTRDSLQKFDHTFFQEQLYKLYESAIAGDTSLLNEIYHSCRSEIEKEEKLQHPENIFHFMIIKLRYYLYMEKMADCTRIVNDLKSLSINLPSRSEYILVRTLALYHYLNQNYSRSMAFLEKAENKVTSNAVKINRKDSADLYYQLALLNSKTMRIYKSISYAENALKMYQSIYDMERSAECHMILGINFRKLKEFTEAEECYYSVLSICKISKNDYLEAMTLQNLGNVNSDLGNSKKAIQYYLRSLEKKKEDDERTLHSYHSLVIEYYHLNDYILTKEWAEKGLKKALQFQNKEYEIHFTIYLHLISDAAIFEEYITKVGILFFQNSGRKEYVIKYTKILAMYLFSKKKYKASSEYLIKTIELSKDASLLK
ncbi:Transcriptional activator NprA [Bacillus sp. THAF10]|uniref:helix-turn-helix domain-containing protein n=1 Tax=Bacillus sp. THAF10 TaxID=2587848 RepID=UPI0012688934|nr:helix-turn-helix transcriptional regulator [Bacillus sp. THAF10]QFT90812.1 Transcriptional activator NprA [Bacillus sp. THAF10]